MKQLKTGLSVAFFALLAACSGGGSKKVMIMASGKLGVSEDQKTITLDPGTTHNEKEIDLAGSDKATLTVKGTPGGDKTFDVNENGHYVLNLKPDTLTGGLVRYGSTGMPVSLSNEQVDHIVDSTQQMMMGQNTGDANKTYFIAPFSLKKITGEEGSKIIGPYNGIPYSLDVDKSGKTPEVYKLSTNKQTRQTLEDLDKQRKKAQQ